MVGLIDIYGNVKRIGVSHTNDPISAQCRNMGTMVVNGEFCGHFPVG